MLGCLMDEGITAICCVLDSKARCVLELPAVQESVRRIQLWVLGEAGVAAVGE